jgi:hypothetical protein
MATTTTLSGRDVREIAEQRKKIEKTKAAGAWSLAARNERAMFVEVLRRIAAHEAGDWEDLTADLAIVQAYAWAALPAVS